MEVEQGSKVTVKGTNSPHKRSQIPHVGIKSADSHPLVRVAAVTKAANQLLSSLVLCCTSWVTFAMFIHYLVALNAH